jgi:hypothetical protein
MPLHYQLLYPMLHRPIHLAYRSVTDERRLGSHKGARSLLSLACTHLREPRKVGDDFCRAAGLEEYAVSPAG